MSTPSSKMTGRERAFTAVMMQQLPDQLPVNALLLTRGIREGGITCDVAQRDGEKMAHAKIAATKKFGGDVIVAGTDILVPVENLGAELEYLPYAQPSLITHPAPTKEAFYRLRDEYTQKGFNPEAGRVREIQKEIQVYVKNGWKDTHVLATPVCGPITTASMITGTSEFIEYLSDDPAYAQDVIDLALDCAKNISRMVVEAGVDVVNVPDPFGCCEVIPPDLFRKFALPAQEKLFAYIKELGAAGFIHMCTFTQPLWQDIAKNGAVNFNGDMYPGADHAKRAIGGGISLMGTLSPFSTLMHGTPQDVANEVKKLAAEVGYNGGFICMPGCDIDWNVSDENLHALIDTCASIKYPMDIEALGDLSKVYLAGNPNHPGMRASSAARDVKVMNIEARKLEKKTPAEEVYANLIDAVMEYDGDKAVEWTKKGLERGLTAQQIVFDGLALGMKALGDMYERNERFVTDLLKASKTMEKALPILTPLLEASGAVSGKTGTVVVGLVRGNTQDLGKNLVVLMLKASGFKVIDLGKNVKPEEFIQAAEANNAVAIGMSVMTDSSVTYAGKTVELLKQQGKANKYLLMAGGAGMNQGLANSIGVKYGSDANAGVSLVREYLATAA